MIEGISLVSPLGIIAVGFVGSLASGLATSIGALPVFLFRAISDKAQDVMMGFGAGVMLAAACFSLIIPGIAKGKELYGSGFTAPMIVAVGMMLGGLFLYFSDKVIPHELFHAGHHGTDSKALKRLWLFVLAVTLHNFPEGLSVGVGYGAGIVNGLSLTLGIGIQNMPEGLVVALGLIVHGYKKSKAFWVATFTGLVEPIGGLVGAGLVTISSKLLPWGMGFAAGAMVCVISGEVIPECQKNGFQKLATLGLMIGFSLMMFLDTALG